jgi:hypothetical protein
VSLELDLRTRFVSGACAGGVAGVAAALDHEPAELPAALADGALVTMLGLPPRYERSATSGYVELVYTWRVFVYVNLVQGYDVAQRALAAVLEPLLRVTVADFNAGGLVDEWNLQGGSGEPQFAHAEGWVYQPLTLTAVIETT